MTKLAKLNEYPLNTHTWVKDLDRVECSVCGEILVTIENSVYFVSAYSPYKESGMGLVKLGTCSERIMRRALK